MLTRNQEQEKIMLSIYQYLFYQRMKNEDIVDIKYNVAVTYDEREQIYCFSCMIIVKDS
jgi:hypothetical protein